MSHPAQVPPATGPNNISVACSINGGTHYSSTNEGIEFTYSNARACRCCCSCATAGVAALLLLFLISNLCSGFCPLLSPPAGSIDTPVADFNNNVVPVVLSGGAVRGGGGVLADAAAAVAIAAGVA